MGELINGRTPEQIRFNISECSRSNCLSECPYENQPIESCAEGLLSDALALIEHLEAKIPRWISVKETLPEKGDNVLISLCGCNVKQAVYRGDGVFEAAYADTYHSTDLGSIVLTHWMPLPEPANNK